MVHGPHHSLTALRLDPAGVSRVCRENRPPRSIGGALPCGLAEAAPQVNQISGWTGWVHCPTNFPAEGRSPGPAGDRA